MKRKKKVLHGMVGVVERSRMIESFWNTDKTHWVGGWYRVKCVWLVANFALKKRKKADWTLSHWTCP